MELPPELGAQRPATETSKHEKMARWQRARILREAAAAGADFVRSEQFVGGLSGYDYLEGGERGATDGAGYYRRPDAPPPDTREYSRMVLQRASAAGADFVACAEMVMALPGYEHRDGHEGVGYYRVGFGAPPAPSAPPAASAAEGSSFSDFLSTMRDLGAV